MSLGLRACDTTLHEHAPLVVRQEPLLAVQTEAPEPMKLTTVPSGTGFENWSARRTVRVAISPSKLPPSMLALSTDNEKDRCSGRPVETDSVSEKLSSDTVALAG